MNANKLALDALKELVQAGRNAIKALDSGIPTGEPVHPISASLTWPLSTGLLAIDALEAEAVQVEPTGYWKGQYSKDGGATLYEEPQVSVFGLSYRNIPLYATPQQPAPVFNFTVLQQFAQHQGINYDELCMAVRESMIKAAPKAPA